LVLADQNNKFKDSLYDVSNKNNFLINRIGGLKFLCKRKKLSELKKYLDIKKVLCIIGDSWKSFELSIDIIRDLSIKFICFVHGNEIIIKNSCYKKRVISMVSKISNIVCNSNYIKDLVKKIGITNQLIVCIYPGVQNNINLFEKIILKLNGSLILVILERLKKRKGKFMCFILQ
jgi:hypothetical protein